MLKFRTMRAADAPGSRVDREGRRARHPVRSRAPAHPPRRAAPGRQRPPRRALGRRPATRAAAGRRGAWRGRSRSTRIRHLVRPGLTGWAQVKYPYAVERSRDAAEAAVRGVLPAAPEPRARRADRRRAPSAASSGGTADERTDGCDRDPDVQRGGESAADARVGGRADLLRDHGSHRGRRALDRRDPSARGRRRRGRRRQPRSHPGCGPELRARGGPRRDRRQGRRSLRAGSRLRRALCRLARRDRRGDGRWRNDSRRRPPGIVSVASRRR